MAHPGGTQISSPPISVNTSITASPPRGMVARRRSRWHPPMNAVMSPPRNGESVDARLLAARAAKSEIVPGPSAHGPTFGKKLACGWLRQEDQLPEDQLP